MRLKAIHKAGWLDVGSQERLENENINFRRCLLPGQSIEVPDQYRGFKNIDSAINAGLLLVVSYDSSPGSLVVNAELWQQEFGSSSSSNSGSNDSSESSESSQSIGGGVPVSEFYALDSNGNTIKVRLVKGGVGFYAMDAGGNTIKVDIPQVELVTDDPDDSSSSSLST